MKDKKLYWRRWRKQMPADKKEKLKERERARYRRNKESISKQKKQYYKAKKLRMLEEAFERVMDKQDGLVGFVAPPETSPVNGWKRRTDSWSTKKGSGMEYSEECRERRRRNSKQYYDNHREEICQWQRIRRKL